MAHGDARHRLADDVVRNEHRVRQVLGLVVGRADDDAAGDRALFAFLQLDPVFGHHQPRSGGEDADALAALQADLVAADGAVVGGGVDRAQPLIGAFLLVVAQVDDVVGNQRAGGQRVARVGGRIVVDDDAAEHAADAVAGDAEDRR